MQLQRDHGCRHLLSWRGDLPAPIDMAWLEARLMSANLYVCHEHPGFITFEEDDTGHRLVVVPRTGRLQLRLYATTTTETREAEAVRVGGAMGRAIADDNACTTTDGAAQP